jgi:predicted nucleic acid-binding protein
MLAVLDADDQLHSDCAAAIVAEREPLLPDAILPELAYMVLRELGYNVLIAFLNSLLQGELAIEKATRADLARATEILEQYADNRVDFVDCLIFAMAERLGIQRILTVDRRHFGAFRPRHCAYFEIIPQ